jgi:hypothetical protein
LRFEEIIKSANGKRGGLLDIDGVALVPADFQADRPFRSATVERPCCRAQYQSLQLKVMQRGELEKQFAYLFDPDLGRDGGNRDSRS